jgi:hypothetical protein
MSFLGTVADHEASGEIADLYEQERQERGYVMVVGRQVGRGGTPPAPGVRR